MINNISDPLAQIQLNSKIKRPDIINALIHKHKFKYYLEIGIFDGFTFNQIDCAIKHGVDPGVEGVSLGTHPMTSDDFFAICQNSYDIIFIDGLHEYQQVIKDFNNSINHIKNNGYILFHDCNPIDKLSQSTPRASIVWNGDVWKAFVMIKQANPHSFVYDTDFGIGVVENNGVLNPVTNTDFNMEWEYFDKNRQELLGLKDIPTKGLL